MFTEEEKLMFKIHSDFCSALANEKRLQIIWLLKEREYSVGEMAAELEISTPNTSQHLRVLRNQGVVIEKKVGQQVYYRVANPKFIQGCLTIREGILETQKKKSDAMR
jgi:ArsR family transcriptional regulator, virulence genes transcriptional regulator